MTATLGEISYLNNKVKSCYKDLDELMQHLQQFEQSHQMSSEEFFKKFSNGRLAHQTGFFEWFACLDMSKHLLTKIRQLEHELGNFLGQKLLAPA